MERWLTDIVPLNSDFNSGRIIKSFVCAARIDEGKAFHSLPGAIIYVVALIARWRGIASLSAQSDEEEDCGDLDELHTCER